MIDTNQNRARAAVAQMTAMEKAAETQKALTKYDPDFFDMVCPESGLQGRKARVLCDVALNEIYHGLSALKKAREDGKETTPRKVANLTLIVEKLARLAGKLEADAGAQEADRNSALIGRGWPGGRGGRPREPANVTKSATSVMKDLERLRLSKELPKERSDEPSEVGSDGQEGSGTDIAGDA